MSVKTTCPYCGVGCGILASADGTIKGDPDHPANYGRLCSKGAALDETIDLAGRLLAPRIKGQEATWDAALDLVAAEFSQAIETHGPDSVAFYVSGQLLTEDYYVVNKLMKGFIGSANIDTNSRLCMASSVAGHKRAFGTDTVPGTYEDLEEADLIVLVGSNLAWCHPVLHQRIAAAKEQRPSMQVVNVDPRRTATSQLADMHLQIAPDGDIALFNGLLAYLTDTGALDLAYLSDHVTGCFDAVQAARATDPLETGLSAIELQRFFRLWANIEKVVTVYSQGVNQSTCGTDKVNAILNCHLATGRIGKPGCGPFSVTGQPNAMGGREVGGLANMLANHLDIENATHRACVQRFWQSPTICSQPGLKAVDLFRACAGGQIKALWVMSTNPAVSLPAARGVVETIANVPFVAVSDIMARTDTGDLADVLLPATGWGEKDGTVTNSERRISRQRAFLPVPGRARPDWKIICDVAARMGWAKSFTYASPSDVFAEYVALSEETRQFGRDLDLGAFEDVDYDAMTPVQWPQDGKRFFADGGFFHPDGKARMVTVAAPVSVKADGYRLNTGRARDQWHTMTRTGKSKRLSRHLAEPYLEIHPDDANALGLELAGLVRVSSGADTCVFRALVTENVTPGRVFAPMHWTRQTSSGACVNQAVTSRVDPISGQPALKGAHVHLHRFEAKWFGYLVSQTPIKPCAEYCAVAKTETGWQAELAGVSHIPDWTDFISSLVGAQPDETFDVTDTGKGITRRACITNGRISQILFIGSTPVRLSRAHAIQQIGQTSSGLAALAGAPGASKPDPGALVCVCMSVGVNTLRGAIDGGASTTEDLGKCTGAGTVCGSCKPELNALISKHTRRLAAE